MNRISILATDCNFAVLRVMSLMTHFINKSLFRTAIINTWELYEVLVVYSQYYSHKLNDYVV